MAWKEGIRFETEQKLSAELPTPLGKISHSKTSMPSPNLLKIQLDKTQSSLVAVRKKPLQEVHSLKSETIPVIQIRKIKYQADEFSSP